MKIGLGGGLSLSRLTRKFLIGNCVALIISYVVVTSGEFSKAKGYVLPSGATIGGDYVAFYAAGHEAANERAAETYDSRAFEKRLKEVGPSQNYYGLTWQYPPTYFFAVLPLAGISFIAGYLIWTGVGIAVFFTSLVAAGFQGLFLLAILAAPSTFQAVITGQNGFLAAALLMAASYNADKRPVLAGLAAAALTMKPHIGLLLPIAYVAGGCWRAFFTAALGALGLAAASLVAFGTEAWVAFLDGFLDASGNLTSGRFPLYKMVTPFAAARLVGLPAEAAAVFHGACAVIACATTAFVWRRLDDADLRAAILCSGVFLVSPYGFYYELVILTLPAAVLVQRGIESGWLHYERLAIFGIFLAPLFLLSQTKSLDLSVGFIVVLAIFVSVLRRIRHERPQTFLLSRSRV